MSQTENKEKIKSNGKRIFLIVQDIPGRLQNFNRDWKVGYEFIGTLDPVLKLRIGVKYFGTNALSEFFQYIRTNSLEKSHSSHGDVRNTTFCRASKFATNFFASIDKS